MLYPQKGSMAIGSRRSSPTAPAAAAVFSLPMIEPRKVPCCQSRASFTSGTTVARRPPKRIALIGTPFGSSHSSARSPGTGSPAREARVRVGGLGVSLSGVQSLPFQSVRRAGGSSVISSHQTSPSDGEAHVGEDGCSREGEHGVRVRIFMLVPGATPKKPASGLMA